MSLLVCSDRTKTVFIRAKALHNDRLPNFLHFPSLPLNSSESKC